MDLKCWLASANDPDCDFPIQNLPYGVFRHKGRAHIGIAIGDQILDLHLSACAGLFEDLPEGVRSACKAEALNELMALGPDFWAVLRRRVTELLSGTPTREIEQALAPMREAEMLMPARIGNYTDFYASIDHAARVGKLFRPDNPLLPNYEYMPIGYHGRASSIVIGGTSIRRPHGQTKPTNESLDAAPTFGPTRSLDYELEVGLFVGPGNRLGEPIPIDFAERSIFGLCLVNDWSARDVQAWEYQPLGPFLAKSFATTISPWIVPLEALAPYRVPLRARTNEGVPPLAYLKSAHPERAGIDLTLEVLLESQKMREAGFPPERICRGNLRDLYWSLAQLVTHHASNGCNLCPGDLLATGTVSGPAEGSEGCLLEMRHRAHPLCLKTGEQRLSLEDGDRVILRAWTNSHGLPRIGFGECTGTVMAAVQR